MHVAMTAVYQKGGIEQIGWIHQAPMPYHFDERSFSLRVD
jgi:hypothetical protein